MQGIFLVGGDALCNGLRLYVCSQLSNTNNQPLAADDLQHGGGILTPAKTTGHGCLWCAGGLPHIDIDCEFSFYLTALATYCKPCTVSVYAIESYNT